jgi:hypothetical protein
LHPEESIAAESENPTGCRAIDLVVISDEVTDHVTSYTLKKA